MMKSDFDWSENGVVVLQEQARTAVYENGNGDIVIRQDGGMEDDSVIIVNRMFVGLLITALIALSGEAANGQPG